MCCVTSFAEVWIEIGIVLCGASHQGVTSFAEVWIEIFRRRSRSGEQSSLPSRKCGLKFSNPVYCANELEVTSFAEVWIEISYYSAFLPMSVVTSFAEVWIEIINGSREKLQQRVTSFAEVWIEIPTFNSS